jgi:hypothetical protein
MSIISMLLQEADEWESMGFFHMANHFRSLAYAKAEEGYIHEND